MIRIDHDLCDLCASCPAVCPVNCIELRENYLVIEQDVCIDCGACVRICPFNALQSAEEYEFNETAL